MAPILGLTGSMGSGKSAVAAMLAELGAWVIDADQLAREAVEPDRPALARIEREFGPGLIDEQGRLRRRALAEKVFGDRAATRRLGAIIHPEVRARTLALIEAHRDRPLIVADIPLLYESGMEKLMDKVAVVTISENQRFFRLRRRGFSEREIIARLGMQMPQARKASLADYLIDNSGSLEATRKQVQNLWDHITRETKRKNHECQDE